MTFDPRADRTALRLKLYEGGFSPLANKNKMCLIKEWSTLKVTPEIIQSKQWARSHSFLDTGIRCGDVIALDFDVDDGKLLNDLLDAVINEGLVDESLFVRIGRPPRELWVYRTKDKIGKRTTGHFLPPDSPEGFAGYAVEILGAGCQFAAYGQRDENTAYQWPEQSLVDHQYMDLPVITLQQVETLKDFCEGFFANHGLTRASAAGGTDGGYTHVYDLTPDMVFDVKDQGPMTVAEIAEALAVNPDDVWRCTVDSFRPTSGSWAGMVSLVNGAVCISDHGTYTSHFPLADDVSASLAKLGALLAERFPETSPPEPENLILDPRAPLDDNLAKALKRYIFVASDALIFDPHEDFQTNTTKQFREQMAPFYEAKLGPRGSEQITWLFDQWMRHPARVTVKDAQMRPDHAGKLLFVNDAARHLNTYDPPAHDALNGDATMGLRLVESLLPDPDERRYFMHWLSFKLQHPHIPGPAVVMVAPGNFGTGRGSVVKLIERLFGKRYVRTIDFDTLIGKGTQSQYNEFMVDSLIVAVNEASESDANTSRWQSRANAYEHLKNIVDPGDERTVHVKRKGSKNTTERTFASFFIASNHGDALVIPSNDRRFAILSNGTAPSNEFFAEYYRWLGVPANVAAFARELLAVDLAGYNPFVAPPMTAAKADMVDAGTSDLDRAAAAVLTKPAGALMVKEQFLLLIEAVMLTEGYEFPEDWQRTAERIFSKKSRRLLGPDRHMVEGKMRSVRLVGACNSASLSDLKSMLDEIGKNGPVTRPIKATGTVVSFQRKAL
jgi:hypothetical protein